jgi:GGDEF domain-containing protein
VVATSVRENPNGHQTQGGQVHGPRPVGFDRVAGEVLDHLLNTSPLAQWLVVRFEGSAMRIVKSAGTAYPFAPERSLARADLSGKPASGRETGTAPKARVVRLRESSELTTQFGVRSCIAATIGDASTGTNAPFGAIVGLDSAGDFELPTGFGEELRLHAHHLSSALRNHRVSFAAEHELLQDRDVVNGFDTSGVWIDRLHLLDRHCSAIGEDATIAVVDVDGLGVLRQQFGHLAADEFIREISYTLRSLSLPNAYFGRLVDDRLVVARVGNDTNGFDRHGRDYWAKDLRSALAQSIASSPTANAAAVRCRVGVATRSWGQRRGLEQAQGRAAKRASVLS